MSGAVAKRTNESSKALGGKASYLWSTIAVFARWRNTEVRVSVDGESRTGRMHEVVVANGRYLGGGMLMCPEASPDDGLFDVLLIGDITKRDLVQTLPKIYRGTHLPHPKAELLRARTVAVDSDEPLPVQLDGEQPGTTPVRFEVVPRALAPARAEPDERLAAGFFASGARFAGLRDGRFARRPAGRSASRARRAGARARRRAARAGRACARAWPGRPRGRASALPASSRRGAAREVGKPLERLLAGLGEPADHVLLRLLAFGPWPGQ